MAFSSKQRKVFAGIATGAIVTAAIVALGIVLNPFAYRADSDVALRLTLAAKASLVPALFVTVAVARLARHRFLTPADIDGGGLSEGSSRARLLQALLQNTLEQAVLASVVYVGWALLVPGSWLSVLPLAALAFAVGRLAFFAGYGRGAPGRAVGFALTFYPTVVMLVILLGHLLPTA